MIYDANVFSSSINYCITVHLKFILHVLTWHKPIVTEEHARKFKKSYHCFLRLKPSLLCREFLGRGIKAYIFVFYVCMSYLKFGFKILKCEFLPHFLLLMFLNPNFTVHFCCFIFQSVLANNYHQEFQR